MRSASFPWVGICPCVLIGLLLTGRGANAEQPNPEIGVASADSDGATAGATKREMERRLRRGQQLLADENFAEGTRLLQSILDSDEDIFFYPELQNKSRERSLKTEAQAQIGQLRPRDREAYERQFGPVARRLLDESIRTRDSARLGLVTRRYFHTQAGAEAAYRLAADYLDHEQPLTAALCFERLRQTPAAVQQFEPMLSLKTALCWHRAGSSGKALQILAELKVKYRKEALVLGEREWQLADDAPMGPAWLGNNVAQSASARLPGLDQWTSVGGNPQRNAESSGGSPYLNRGWRASTITGTTTSPESDELLEKEVTNRKWALRTGDDDSPLSLVPTTQPLIVGDLVITRTVGDVRAFELATGKLVWATGEKDQLLHEIIRSGGGGGMPGQIPGLTVLQSLLFERLCQDATFGTIASDSEFVFAIEDLGIGGLAMFPTRNQWQREYNRLVAYDVKSGKAVWELGGPKTDSADETAGMFFLGAPLVLDRRLFVLAESGSEVRLLVLEPRTGRVDWSQTLSDAPLAGFDFYRRQSGLTPSFDGGILVCPTGSEQVVALDLTARSLLWRYRLRNRVESPDLSPQQLLMMQQQRLIPANTSRWVETPPIISDSQVLIVPREGNELHCLNLLDGSLAWKRPRGDGLFVAGVRHGRVLIVGSSWIQALSLQNGEPAWKEPVKLPIPSGRGFLAGDHYHLPLSTAEVATIHILDGRIVSRSKSLAEHVPGNLIANRGVIVSQGADFVESFRQLETLEAEISQTLSINPDEPTALALRGEIRLQRGLMQEARADLQRAMAINPDDAGLRSLLTGSLLEGLRVDFATYRELAGEAEKILTTPEQRSTLLWLMANGLIQSRETVAAFETLARFADPNVDDRELERLDATYLIRRDRLVRLRLQELYLASTPSERQALDQRLNDRTNRLAADKNLSGIRRHLAYFGALPIEQEPLRRLSLELPSDDAGWLADELVYAGLAESANPRLAGPATARMAMLLLAAERPRDALYWVSRVQSRFPDALLLGGGKTGSELAAAWRQRAELERELADQIAWPAGQVESERLPAIQQPAGFRSFLIPFAGERNPAFEDTLLEVNGICIEFLLRVGLGRIICNVSLANPIQTNNINFNRAYLCDHFVLISFGTQLLAVDTLGTADQPGARVLWQVSLSDVPAGNVLPRGLQNGRRRGPFNQLGEQLGTIGPVTREHIGLVRGRKLTALETLTGKPLWVRDGIIPGSELFGDSEYLFVVPPDATEATAYRALDGSSAGVRPLPPIGRRLETIGRSVLTWQTAREQSRLALFDVITGADVWSHEFPEKSHLSLMELDEVAILEPSGRFAVYALTDGKLRFESQIEPNPKTSSILALRSRDQYTLMANEPVIGNAKWMQGTMSSVQVNGLVHGFDRATGKKLWTTEVARHAIEPNQPQNLPVLTFISAYFEQRKNGAGFDRQFGLLLLDRRNGEIVYDDRRADENVFHVDYVVDPDLKQLEIKLFQSAVKLTFTDKPIPEKK